MNISDNVHLYYQADFHPSKPWSNGGAYDILDALGINPLEREQPGAEGFSDYVLPEPKQIRMKFGEEMDSIPDLIGHVVAFYVEGTDMVLLDWDPQNLEEDDE